MKFFEGIHTIEDLKKKYRKLAFKFHPDNMETGNIEIMQVLNNEYEKLFNLLKNGKEKQNKTEENSMDFINIINELMKYTDLTIEIIGTWIWLEKDNTYNIKDIIKGLGFLWSSSRKKWYFNGCKDKQKIAYKQKAFNQLKNEYGCQTIKTDTKKEYKEIK